MKINSIVRVHNKSGSASLTHGRVGVVVEQRYSLLKQYYTVELNNDISKFQIEILEVDLVQLDESLTREIWESTYAIKETSDRLLKCGKIIENLRQLNVVLAASKTLRDRGEFGLNMTDLLQHGFGDTITGETRDD
jgi:hypothetical protein